GELDDERPHVGVVGPCPVDLVGRPDHGLAGGDPNPLIADGRPAAALDDDEVRRVGVRVGLDPAAAVEGQLRHDAAGVAVDHLAADALRAGRASGPAVADPEPAVFFQHPATTE